MESGKDQLAKTLTNNTDNKKANIELEHSLRLKQRSAKLESDKVKGMGLIVSEDEGSVNLIVDQQSQEESETMSETVPTVVPEPVSIMVTQESAPIMVAAMSQETATTMPVDQMPVPVPQEQIPVPMDSVTVAPIPADPVSPDPIIVQEPTKQIEIWHIFFLIMSVIAILSLIGIVFYFALKDNNIVDQDIVEGQKWSVTSE